MEIKVLEYMKIMGFRVRDIVTGFQGVATAVSFDLYGCIQVVVQPPAGEGGKIEESRWFDHKRLAVFVSVTAATQTPLPVMEVPNYVAVGGGQALPSQEYRP